MFPVEKQKMTDDMLGNGQYKPGYTQAYFPGCTHGFAARGDPASLQFWLRDVQQLNTRFNRVPPKSKPGRRARSRTPLSSSSSICENPIPATPQSQSSEYLSMLPRSRHAHDVRYPRSLFNHRVCTLVGEKPILQRKTTREHYSRQTNSDSEESTRSHRGRCRTRWVSCSRRRN
jgi:hypothetical protein